MSKKRTIINQRKRRTAIITTTLVLSAVWSAVVGSQAPLVVVQTPSVHVHLVISSGPPGTSCHMLTLFSLDYRPAADYIIRGRPIM
jgi:hypothetical protein